MGFLFEWDPNKAAENLQKHGVSFEEAATIFADFLSVTIDDPLHSDDEQRLVIIGQTVRGQTLVVVHTVRGDKIRIISARQATKQERKSYEHSKNYG